MNIAQKTKMLTLLGVLIAVQIVLTALNIGMIPFLGIKATTLHIPVIVGALLLGPKEGMLLGGVMGMISVITNTFQPVPTSFVFSPFITMGDQSGNLLSLVVAIIPRVLIGVTAYYSYKFVCSLKGSTVLGYIIAGIVGSFTNTVLVLGSIYVLFGPQYAEATNVAYSGLLKIIMLAIGTNGVPEAILAGILVPVITRPLSKIFRLNRTI